MNETEAPTSEATVDGRRPDPMLTDEQLDFVTFVEQIYQMQGVLVTKEIASEYLFEEDDFNEFMGDELVRAAIAERGILHRKLVKNEDVAAISPLGDGDDSTAISTVEKPTWKDGALSWQQLQTANVMLDLIDTRSEKKKLQDLGIPTSLYNTWMQDEVFTDYLKTRAEAIVQKGQHIAHMALMDKVRMGDQKAIEYYNEYVGKFIKASASGSSGAVTNTAVNDFKRMLTDIVDIIDQEVEDEDTALRIADRLLKLINRENVVTGLMEAMEPTKEHAAPEVMPQQELSPNLQRILDREKPVV